MNKLTQDEMNPDLIDRINALAIDQSLTLPDGRVITCRANNSNACREHCCVNELPPRYCIEINCQRELRSEPQVVYFELTAAPAATTGEGR